MPKGIPNPKTRGEFETDKAWWDYRQKLEKGVLDNIQSTKDFEAAIDKLYLRPTSLSVEDDKVETLKTNTLLDDILSPYGGLEPGSTLELFGEYAGSKTQICKTFTAEAPGLIAYIDAEDTFRKHRLIQICKARGKSDEYIKELIEKRLLLYSPENWMEQYWISKNLPEYDKDNNFLKVGLIIIDSAMKLFADSENFFGRENLGRRQQLVRAHLLRLKFYAKRHGGVMVFTNQIYDKPTGVPQNSPMEMKIGGRGGRSIEHIPDYRVLLIKKRGAIRVARLLDSLDQPLSEVPFMLSDKGIENIPDEAELAKALETSKKYGDKFESGQAGTKKAGKKYDAETLKALANEMGLDVDIDTPEEILEENSEEINGEE